MVDPAHAIHVRETMPCRAHLCYLKFSLRLYDSPSLESLVIARAVHSNQPFTLRDDQPLDTAGVSIDAGTIHHSDSLV